MNINEPADALGLHSLMMSFVAPGGEQKRSPKQSQQAEPPAVLFNDFVVHGEAAAAAASALTAADDATAASSSSSPPSAPHPAAAVAVDSQTQLPRHLAPAQKFMRCKLQQHPVYGDEDGRAISVDMAGYAREIYRVPASPPDPNSFTKLRSVPRISVHDRDLFEAAMEFQIPVVLTNSTLVARSCARWTPDYLASKFRHARPMSVSRSESAYFR